jgi:hypothetical protein
MINSTPLQNRLKFRSLSPKKKKSVKVADISGLIRKIGF